MAAVAGHDLKSLLFSFMDEFLYVFGSEYLVCKQVAFSDPS